MTATLSRQAWIIAAAGLVLLCLAFTQEIASAVNVWNTSTAYGHCWLVLPIVGWLLWERRAVVAAGVACPTAWPILAAIPLALGWIVADWLGIMEGRQLALVGFVELLLLAVFGWRLWWALSPAFLYLLFLVPFGAFLTPALQRFTTGFILAGLRLLDVPFEADAFRITIPEGVFYVAEACAGLRFLIASVAFGVLYAVTIFRSPARRAAYIAVACVVPVVANGFRGLGIVLLGHELGSAQAGAADHLIYGWVFFSFVIVLLALAGLPFRQDMAAARPAPPIAGPLARWPVMIAACAPVLLVAYGAPLLARRLDAGAVGTSAAQVPTLVLPSACRAATISMAGPASTQVLQCGVAQVRVVATALSAGTNPASILAAARDPASAGLGIDIDSEAWRTPSGAPWMMLTAHDTGHQAAYAVLVDGDQMLGGLQDRLRMARDMLGAAGVAPVAVTVTLDSSGPDAEEQLRDFLAAQPRLSEWFPKLAER